MSESIVNSASDEESPTKSEHFDDGANDDRKIEKFDDDVNKDEEFGNFQNFDHHEDENSTGDVGTTEISDETDHPDGMKRRLENFDDDQMDDNREIPSSPLSSSPKEWNHCSEETTSIIVVGDRSDAENNFATIDIDETSAKSESETIESKNDNNNSLVIAEVDESPPDQQQPIAAAAPPDDEDDDDEWNDFEFASTPAAAVNPIVVVDSASSMGGEENWAATEKWEPQFPSSAVERKPSIPTEPPSSGPDIAPPTTSSSSVSLSMNLLLDDLGQMLHDCLDDSRTSRRTESSGDESEETSSTIGLSILSEMVGENGTIDRTSAGKDEEREAVFSVWSSLRLLEEAAALKYQWSESVSNQRHLRALRMDSKLAKLRNPKLPAYAWQMSNSALTPEKSLGGGSSNPSSTLFATNQSSMQQQQQPFEREKSTGEECSPSPSSVAMEASSPSIGKDRSSSSTMHGGDLSNGSSHVTPVPPQFDWGSSGLSNPLCEGSMDAGSSMDLDYFSTAKSSRMDNNYVIGVLASASPSNNNSSVVVDASWKNDLKLLGLTGMDELEQEDRSSISRSAASVGISNSKSVLDKLMMSGGGGHTNWTNPESLGDEARSMVDGLADLGFMLSPVLMFPVRETDDVHL